AQSVSEILLMEHLAGFGCFTLLTQMRQHYFARVGPLLQSLLLTLDRVGELGFDRITICHLYRWAKYLHETQFAELSQHYENPAGRARCNGRQWAILGRKI